MTGTVRPVSGHFTALARDRFTDFPGRLLFLPPLPFGAVTSLRIGAFCRNAACQPTFRMRPISLRSPRPILLLVSSYGSSFQARYVSVGLLFLKPLGTN
jgi:hypothetical protein